MDLEPDVGVDLFWEGSRWVSRIIEVPALASLKFWIMRVIDTEDILENHPTENRQLRRFEWLRKFWHYAPKPGEVLEVKLFRGLEQEGYRKGHCTFLNIRTLPRSACTIRSTDDFRERIADHREGSQRCYTFDGKTGAKLDFILYLPPGFYQAAKPFPILMFMHAMHGCIDGDISLMYESEAPPQLLLEKYDEEEDKCSNLLRNSFVVICPQCPIDWSHGYGSGVWLYTDWYHEPTYLQTVEDSLAGLVEAIAQHPCVDEKFVACTGTSMGGLGCLELASRRPGLIQVLAPVAAHYEFDVDALADRLTREQELPMWFFHATNDSLCPIETVDTLVKRIKEKTRAEVRYTRYLDTWSATGHFADRVCYHTVSHADEQQALGNELFAWMLEQRRT